jgi:hypothetical protein
MDGGHLDNMATTGISCSTRANSGRFRVDFTLLTKSAAIAAYNIGTPMQNIKFFGGWARESDVVRDYIDPTVLPSP